MLDAKGKIVTKAEKEAEALNVFASAINSKTSYPQGSQPLELVGRDGANRIEPLQSWRK